MIADKISEYLKFNELTINDHLVNQIKTLAGWAFQRQFMAKGEDRAGSVSLSQAGKCARQIAYNYHGYEKNGKEIDGRARMIFFQGDLVELTLMTLAKLAGCPIVGTGLNQINITLDVNGVLINGHPDGFLIGSDMTRLVECKSMASYAFDRFENGEVDDSYAAQINAYLEATNLDECVLVAMNKDNGIVKETVIYRDPILINKIKDNLNKVLISTKEALPDQPIELNADAKGMYPWNCLYCSYWKTCRPTATQKLVGRSYKLCKGA